MPKISNVKEIKENFEKKIENIRNEKIKSIQ